MPYSVANHIQEHMLALKVLDAEELAPLIRIAE